MPITAARRDLGVAIRYDTPVKSLELKDGRFIAAITEGGERIEAQDLRAGLRRL